MIFISEWLPNPVGKDSEGEWVELFNDGSAAVSLSGWRIENGAGGTFPLSGVIGAGEYRLWSRPALKLTLRNQNETLTLYDGHAALVHQSSFKGTAQEGKSVNLLRGRFLFGAPTPGAENSAQNAALIQNVHAAGVPLRAASLGALDITGLALGVGVLFAVGVLYILRRNEHLYKFFFGGDEEIR
ncbi:MAG: lamin tail domain-containing protein [Candidatus Liptonbacteria bacterium]|nr:lamin tail domain-containing protein [Candidatus Liptonbacteria bacterium]